MRAVRRRGEFPACWLVKLIDGRIEEYTEPSPAAASPDYRLRRDYAPTDEIPLTLDCRRIASIPVRNLLP